MFRCVETSQTLNEYERTPGARATWRTTEIRSCTCRASSTATLGLAGAILSTMATFKPSFSDWSGCPTAPSLVYADRTLPAGTDVATWLSLAVRLASTSHDLLQIRSCRS